MAVKLDVTASWDHSAGELSGIRKLMGGLLERSSGVTSGEYRIANDFDRYLDVIVNEAFQAGREFERQQRGEE